MNYEAQPFQAILVEELNALRPGLEGVTPANVLGRIHTLPQGLNALCFSGGGIRSATFALGVLQGLADFGILEQVDYLSTVSGGGYMGGWLTAWIHRAGGLPNVLTRLRSNCSLPPDPHVDPIQHLRDFNSYLAPRSGAFSTDTWALLATIARNIMLNWLVLIPLMLVVLMLPRLMMSLMRFAENFNGKPPVWWNGFVSAVLVTGVVLAGISVYNLMRFLPGVGKVTHTQGDFVRLVLLPLVVSCLLVNLRFSWWPTVPEFSECLNVALPLSFGGWALFLVMEMFRNPRIALSQLFSPITFALLLSSLCIAAELWVMYNIIFNIQSLFYDAITTLAPPLLLMSLMFGSTLFIGLTSDAIKEEDREWLSRAGAMYLLFVLWWLIGCGLVLMAPEALIDWELKIRYAVAGLALFAGIATALAGFNSRTRSKKDDPRSAPLPLRLVMALAPPVFLLLLVVGLSLFIDWILAHIGFVNVQWWQHRLLLSSVGIRYNLIFTAILLLFALLASYFINLNRFSLHAMYRNRLVRAYLGASNLNRDASEFTGFAENDNLRMRDIRPQQRPFHILNITLNLVSGTKLAWQQRKAQSFTISPLHCGNSDLGYRTAVLYGKGISLGTAMTISGAAASPSMGYHSSTLVAFVMTLFNARLGAWLGNPGESGAETWRHGGPHYALASLVREALGITNNTGSYVYLSDGAHFENLGLYEMVQRRCRHIVVVDGSADPLMMHEDLGNAIRKIRIDLEIPITFETPLPQLEGGARRCAIGRIGYSCVDGACQDGVLIYIKPMLLGNEPPDLNSYAATQPLFPHEPTSNQWFNESQTESYRMLGLHTMRELCANWNGGAFDTFPEHLRTAYLAGGS